MKNSFWNEASSAGVILGLTSISFSLLTMVLPQKLNIVLSGLSFIATIYLLYMFTKRRAMRFPNEGYSYSQCLGFMVASGIFAGIITGAYQIVASNFLFTESYEQTYKTMIATYAEMGIFDNNAMDAIKSTLHSYLFSPIHVLISNIMAMCFSFGFYGLFIAIGTKREEDIFDQTPENEE
ncbi:MAG: DUF4199 domain-containing protein [Alistipes sp.]|nr:DUF4199 domain-containing protein [Alistipes sp.]